MIKISESLKLAKIKFKTRKLRNFLSGCSISLGIIIILVFLLATSGVSSLAKKVFKDSNANRYFARDYISQQYDYGAAPSSVSRTEDNKKLSIEQYKDKRSSYNFKNVFRESYSSGQQVRLDGLEPKDMFISDSYTVTATDETFVKDFLYNDFSFEDKYGDEIPVVVPKDFVIALESNGFLGNSKAKYVVFKNGVDKYIGKSYTVINTPFQTEGGAETPGFKEEKLNLKFKIVGFATSDFGGFGGGGSRYSYSFTVPNWALDKSKELNKLFEIADTTFIPEFNNKKELEDFVKKEISKNGIEPIIGRYEAFSDGVKAARKFVFGIGAFFLTISALFILTTLGKIVTDSRKEIGVFRAIGAQKKDIKKIFFSYAFLLSTLGFIIGLVISSILVCVASLLWGDGVFYQIADLGSNINFRKPVFIFLGFPIIPIILLYFFTLLIGFMASYLPARKASRIDPIRALREE